MESLKQDISNIIEGLEKKKKELFDERVQYKEGCRYDIYLSGIIQGIHYALKYPFGAMVMGKLEAKSRDNDKKEQP